MFRMIFSLLLYIIAFSSFSQQSKFTPIDTLSSLYKSDLILLYNERSAVQMASYKKFPERNLRSSLVESYKEYNDEFLEKVKQGHFIQGTYYNDRLNDIFQQIVKANTKYAQLASTKILLSFSDAPNAYAMGNGFVVVNIPLIASIKNEYELAFVICHELAHNLLNHPENGMVAYAKLLKSDEIKEKTKEIRRNKYNRADNARSLYREILYNNRKKARLIEFQADSLGFVLYKNAFKGKEFLAVKGFETLDDMDRDKDSLQPQDYKKLFSSPAQPFKNEWLAADEISGYKYNKTRKFWDVDSLKTHPDCVDRAIRLKQIFKPGEALADSSDSDASFVEIKKNAGYDNVLGLFILKQYGKSLYQALLLLKDDESSGFLKQMVFANLARIHESQLNYTMNKYVDTVNPKYAYSYNVFLTFLRQLRKSEFNTIINQYQ